MRADRRIKRVDMCAEPEAGQRRHDVHLKGAAERKPTTKLFTEFTKLPMTEPVLNIG